MVDGGVGHWRMVAGPWQMGGAGHQQMVAGQAARRNRWGASGWCLAGAGWDADGHGVTEQVRSSVAGRRLGGRRAPGSADGRPRRPPCGWRGADGLGWGHVLGLDAADFRLRWRGVGAQPRPTWRVVDSGASLGALRRGRTAACGEERRWGQ